MKRVGIFLLVVWGTLAVADPKTTPPKTLQGRLFQYGMSGKIGALDFELDAWADQTLSFERVNEFDSLLAQRLWPPKQTTPTPPSDAKQKDGGKTQDTSKDSAKKGSDTSAGPTNERLPLDKQKLKAAVAAATPALTPLQNHMLALLVRISAENLFDQAPEQMKSELRKWQQKEIEALAVLRPHAKLAEILPASLKGRIRDAWEKNEPKSKLKFEDLTAANLTSPEVKAKLDPILSSLGNQEQALLMASLDQLVESSHDKNIGPTRYFRKVLEFNQALQKEGIKSKTPEISPHQWGNDSDSGGGDGFTSGPPPSSTRPDLCSDPSESGFQAKLKEERNKSSTVRVNQAIQVQTSPGLTGMCGSSVMEQGPLLPSFENIPDETRIPVKVLTAAHCVLQRVGRGQYVRRPVAGMRVTMPGISRGVNLHDMHIPNFPGDSTAPAGLGHDIAVLDVDMSYGDYKVLKQNKSLVKLADSVPSPDQPVMIHMNPEMLKRNGCSAQDYGSFCNQGILAATMTRESIVSPNNTYGVSVVNDCNQLQSGSYPRSIQQGTSGSPIGFVGQDGTFNVVGVQSTKTIYSGADGFFGSIAGVDSPSVYLVSGYPIPPPRLAAGTGGARTH